jgi:hypothetical protein
MPKEYTSIGGVSRDAGPLIRSGDIHATVPFPVYVVVVPPDPASLKIDRPKSATWAEPCSSTKMFTWRDRER